MEKAEKGKHEWMDGHSVDGQHTNMQRSVSPSVCFFPCLSEYILCTPLEYWTSNKTHIPAEIRVSFTLDWRQGAGHSFVCKHLPCQQCHVFLPLKKWFEKFRLTWKFELLSCYVQIPHNAVVLDFSWIWIFYDTRLKIYRSLKGTF